MDYHIFTKAYRDDLTENPWKQMDFAPSELINIHDLLVQYGQLLHPWLHDNTHRPVEQFAQLSKLYVQQALALAPIVRQHHEATLSSVVETTESHLPIDDDDRTFRELLLDANARRYTDPARRQSREPLLTIDPQHYARVMTGAVWSVQMFGHTQSQWHQILTGHDVHPDAWRRSQIGVANNAATTIAHRDLLYDAGALYLPELEPLRKTITGVLAEADALITLLEVARTEIGLSVIPAPPQFEAYAGAANADFLVLDLVREQIMGIQVKSSGAHEHRERYDPDRIILIDASLHLFGTLSRRTRLGHSDTSTRSWPGQVTGHFLNGISPSRPQWPWLDRRELAAARGSIRNIVTQARDRNHEATEIVREKVLTALSR